MADQYIHICYCCMTPLQTESEICPVCGYSNGTACAAGELPPGQILQARYLVGCSIIKNPYMIRYLGYDCRRGQKVWIEELYPRDCSVRESDTATVSVKSWAAEAMQRAAVATMQTVGKLRDAGRIRGVATVLDCFIENGTVYAILEWEAGEFLRSGTMEQRFRDRIEELAAPMAAVLAQMHEKRIVHGALHPENVLITPEGKPVIVGMGSGISAFTRLIGERHGTEMSLFLAPECRSVGSDLCSAQADVYGFAALLCWITAGGVFKKDIEEELDITSSSSMQKKALIEALQKKPDERPQSIMQFYEFFTGEASATPEKERTCAQKKNGKVMAVLGVLLMLIGLLSVLMGLALQKREPAVLQEETAPITQEEISESTGEVENEGIGIRQQA